MTDPKNWRDVGAFVAGTLVGTGSRWASWFAEDHLPTAKELKDTLETLDRVSQWVRDEIAHREGGDDAR